MPDSLWDSLLTSLGNSLWDSLGDSLWDSLWDSLGASLWDSLRASLGNSLGNSLCPWWQHRAGWLEGGRVLGVKYDEAKYQLFRRSARLLRFCVPREGACIVSRNPTDCHWQDGELHSDTGMALCYADGWGLWMVSGVRVDEQIVMRPGTQTLDQITGEENEEVKRIRIERFGWERYLQESNAEVIEVAQNEIEQTTESLMQVRQEGDDPMRVLVCACPSTARVYAMEVPPEVGTCRDAQNWLRNSEKGYCVGAS